MKIHDSAFVQAIWTLILRQISKDVLLNFTVGRKALVLDNENWLSNCSSIHVRSRHNITDVIQPQQIYKRIRQLDSQGYFSWTSNMLMFTFGTNQAKLAFKEARQFWISKGIPNSLEGEKTIPVLVPDYEKLVVECFEHLQSKFRSVDWNELEALARSRKEKNN